MKKIHVAGAAVVFVLAFVMAFADEMPIMTESREVGTLLNSEAPGYAKRFSGDLFYKPQDVISPMAKKDFSGPLVPETIVDVGTALYNSAFETKLAEGIRGAAAGGVAKEDENTRIWDNLLGAPGGSDLP